MKQLFFLLTLLFTLAASAQPTYEKDGDLMYLTVIDSTEYQDAIVLADEIFEYEYSDAYVISFQLYTDIWYEKVEFKESDMVLYTKQIREEFYGY